MGYRVDFWQSLGPTPESGYGTSYAADEWLLTDARDVAQVIEWAETRAGGRTYTIFAIHERGDERELIHLFGVDPTVAE